MKPRLRIKAESGQIAALRAFSASGDARLSARAQIVLARLEGKSLRETTATTGAAAATVQLWTSRFRRFGPEGLLTSAGTGTEARGESSSSGVSSSSDPAAAHDTKTEGRPGPKPAEQERMAAFLRAWAASGAGRPGGSLPPRAWFAREFGVSRSTVRKALSRLEREGFVKAGSRRAPRLADDFPFRGRFLFVRQYLEYGEGEFGLDRSLEEACRRLGEKRGIRFDMISPEPGARGDELRQRVRTDVAAHRYAGVFLRAASAAGSLPFDFLLRMDGVPVSGFVEKGAADLGSLATRFADARLSDRDPYILLRTLLAECRATGARRVCVLDCKIDAKSERDGPRIAANHGLALHRLHHLRLSLSDFLWNRKVLEMVFRMRDPRPPEAIVACNDMLAAMACEFLVRHFGPEKARAFPVIAAGNRPVLPQTALPVKWHGLDCEATLAAFVDWAEACRAGSPRPAPPARAWF